MQTIPVTRFRAGQLAANRWDRTGAIPAGHAIRAVPATEREHDAVQLAVRLIVDNALHPAGAHPVGTILRVLTRAVQS